MAYVNFTSKKVLNVFTTPNSMNAWAVIDTLSGWRLVQKISADGVTNMFIILTAAKMSGRTVTGSYDSATGQLYTISLN